MLGLKPWTFCLKNPENKHCLSLLQVNQDREESILIFNSSSPILLWILKHKKKTNLGRCRIGAEWAHGRQTNGQGPNRFIINIPQEERLNPIRIFFQIELAHWFYLDFYCIENPELHTCGIKDFSSQIFRHCPFLNQYAEEVDKRLEDWKQYKMSVPTYGAIILDPEIKFCLLVQGYWAKSSWGFPKGKINEEETEQECAVREVFEETGFNISELINATDYIENQMYDQLTRLYIIAGVSLDTKFQTKTRKEIKCMQWFPVDALPAHKKDQTCRTQLNMNSNNFFTVIPFIKPLRKWIANKKQQNHDLKSQLVGKVDMSGVIAPGPVNGNLTPVNGRQLTDKQRLKQQQSYNQQVFADFHEYQKLRDGKSSSLLGVSTGNGFKGSGNKMLNNGCNSNNSSEAGSHLIMTDSNNSHKFHKNRHSASPKQNYKKILSRDKMKESDSGLLGFCLHDLELNKATAWSNFRLNLEAIWTGLP